MRHNCEVLETLLQAGASIESQGPPRTSVLAAQTALTPLLVAAICGNVETLQFLISRGADPKYAETNTNKTALMCAATHGHRDCLERLVAAGVDLNVQSSGRRTALSLAIAHKHEQAALLLIQRGAALDVLDALGATVLDFAVELGLEDVAHELARRGAVFGNRSRNSYTLIRLWNVYAGEFRAFGVFAHGVPMPAYATLSHRLATKEVTYDVIRGLPISEAKVTVASNNMSNSWNKVENFSRRCAALGITWAWTGSLCVSRSDKTEFAEARRHTFAWIAAAAKHFIYLDDTDSEDCWNFTTRTPNAFKQPWFLQEFLANPAESTLLFNKHWKRLGSRAANSAALGVVLGMRAEHVVDYKQACIAAKLSWCAQLKSPPVEDRVYAAANVLGVQLQHRYGEGEPQALRRLQEALIDSQDDESLFAWNPMLRGGMTDLNVSLADSDVISDLLATSLDDFAGCHDMRAEAGENRFSLRRGENGDILGVEIKLRGPQPAQSKVDVAFLLHCGLSRTLTPNTRLSLRLQRERGTQRWERLRPTHGIPGDASRDGRRSIFRTRADSRSYVIFLPR